MAVDVFLNLDGVKGESKDANGHAGEIDVLSFSWGCSNGASFAHGGGGGAGKVSYSDLNIMLNVCKASVVLMEKCATGDHIKKAVLTVRKAGKTQQEFYIITLTDLLVSSYQASASSEIPTDSVSLAFSKIEFQYKPQKGDGSLEAAVFGKYDITGSKNQ